MDRRKLLKALGLSSVAFLMGANRVNALKNQKDAKKNKSVLRIAHITDIHIRPEHNAPTRFKKCLEKIKKHKIDFFLNGGDTIYAADYNHIKRERVIQQWAIWKKSKKDISEYDIYSCLGNHDMWWAAPNKTDVMYGKDFVVKQLDIPNRYYSFSKKGWHFIVLDSNNENAGSIDKEQMAWLKNELSRLPTKTPVLIMTHYPILNVSTIIDGGSHTDSKELTKLFYKHRDKRINCVSGHVHLLDNSTYNNVNYYCNGSVSGFWWEDGNIDSAEKYWYHETPPGYAILELYEDGTMTNKYYQHNF
jgi:3',5'-cyclic AMP phosphodiesterase CpdA